MFRPGTLRLAGPAALPGPWFSAAPAAFLLLPLLTGCFVTPRPTLREESRGLVYMFPGIFGGPWYLGEAYRGLRDGGVEGAILIDEWDLPVFDGLGHLQNIERNRQHAAEVAAKIAAYRARWPEAPIDLVGYSAGGGVAVLVAERVPREVRLRNVVLVQAAVSPDYDLSGVLERIAGHVVNLYAAGDWVILGLGTEAFGTVDRHNTASCGKVGFDVLRAVPEAAQRERLIQQAWAPEDVWTGHVGMHNGILLRRWNAKCVAPWVRSALPQAAD